MSYEIVMPQLGLTMTEGSVSVWLKSPGEKVEKGEALFTVETDKVEMEVESAAAGYLAAIYVEPKKVVPTGTVIAVLADKPEDIAAVAESRRPAAAAQAATAAASAPSAPIAAERAPGETVPVSPRARKVAKELGIDLALVTPTNGARIVEEDVRRFQSAAAAAPKPVPAPVQPLAGARRVLAERVSRSFREAPHFYLTAEINASALVDFREKLKAASERAGARLTYTDLLIKAMAITVSEQPAVNTYWSDGGIVPRDSVDVAFAVDGGESLLVPVIRGLAALTLFDIARQRSDLAGKARAGKLTLPEMEGGSVTLSNLGQFGVDSFQAVLNPPQSLIVAAGRIARRPVVISDRVEACPTLTLTVSIDHRVLDGVAGARFLARLKELLENPLLMLL